jgi:hypothetical protein
MLVDSRLGYLLHLTLYVTQIGAQDLASLLSRHRCAVGQQLLSHARQLDSHCRCLIVHVFKLVDLLG